MFRPVHFEMHSLNPERDMKFFGEVFGWKFEKFAGSQEDMPYYLATTGKRGSGINGGMMRSPDGKPRTVNTIDVPDVDEYAAKVAASGGKVVMPKMTIPGVGYVIYCTDPGGNLFGIWQNDSTAQ